MERVDVEFTDQSPTALRLALVEGDFDQTQFPQLVSNTFKHEGIVVEATIIGASHMVSFRTADFEFHEVFACETPEKVSSRPLEDLAGGPIVERFFPNMRYSFIAGRYEWQYPEPQSVLAIAGAARDNSSEGIGLVFDFPAGGLVAVPKTVVNIWPCPDGILASTLHSYPEQGYVLSLSALLYTY